MARPKWTVSPFPLASGHLSKLTPSPPHISGLPLRTPGGEARLPGGPPPTQESLGQSPCALLLLGPSQQLMQRAAWRV